MRRPLQVELLRGTAPAAALAIFGGTVWMLCVHADVWAGRWAGLVGYFRVCLLILCALMVAAGAWQAGRERRRGMGELLASTPRPAWQPLLVSWLSVAVAGSAGAVAVLGGAAALVGAQATYPGRDWWWVLLVGLLALWAAAAFGVLVGRLVPYRAIAPIAGVATYVGLGATTYVDVYRATWLSPVRDNLRAELLIPGELHLAQAAWLLALTATLLALAARIRWVTVVAVALTAAAAVPIVTGPRVSRLPTDPRAVEPVCTTDGPPVCMARVNAFLLDDVAAAIQPLLTRMAGIPGAPTRAADSTILPDGQVPGQAETVWLNLLEQPQVFGGLAEVSELRSGFRQITEPFCDHAHLDYSPEVDKARTVALQWLLDEQQPLSDLPTDRLRALPLDQQRAWFGEYLAAARACDGKRLAELGERL
ncbi:ABC transporter permease [Micromonospora sp. NPDC006766]|uniref:ABC transporter permease n=1 Tax=Micromonospora sp. NPDC006766 TaxID=3154778 RepID=UPI003401BF96